MTTITVKNIPSDLYERLKDSAASNRRSINSEIIVAIENAVSIRRVNVNEMLVAARQLRALTAHVPISDDELNELKQAGRE